MRSFICVLLLATPLLGAVDVATTALLVNQPDDAVLREALTSNDVAVRTIAARVAGLTNRTALLPLMETMLATEPDAEVARELIRAALVMGGTKEIDAAVATSGRFAHRLDMTVAIGIARQGTAEALSAYAAGVVGGKTGIRSSFFILALWNAPDAIGETSTAILSRGDDKGWAAFLDALNDSQIAVDGRMLSAAFGSRSERIASETVIAILSGYGKGIRFSEGARSAMRDVNVPGDLAAPAFLAELVRRIGQIGGGDHVARLGHQVAGQLHPGDALARRELQGGRDQGRVVLCRQAADGRRGVERAQ